MTQGTGADYREMTQKTTAQPAGIAREFAPCTCTQNSQNSATVLRRWG